MDFASLGVMVDSRQVRSGERDLDQFGRTSATVSRTADNLTKKIVGLAAAYASLSTINNVIQTFAAFSDSISELSAITGAAGNDLKFLSAQAKDIGRTTTLSASQAAQAFKLIASAKPDLLESGAALNTVTRQAVLLAEAARIDLTQAAASVGTSLNQFGADADQAARFVNVLAAGAKFGSSEIAQTSEALKNAGAAANAAGISFESTNAAIQALAAGGIRAAEAGTGLRNIILILEQQTDKNLRPSVVGLTQAIENLSEKNLNLTEMTKIFGRESAVAAQTIVDQADSLSELERRLTGTNTAAEQASINNDNLAKDWAQAMSASEGLQISIGERLNPSLREHTQELAKLLNITTDFVDSYKFDKLLENTGDAAEALAVIFAARLTPSILANIAATRSAIAESIRYQTALAAMAGISGRAAIAQTALGTAAAGARGALALIGGPSGAAILAAYALWKLYDALGSTNDELEKLHSNLERLDRSAVTAAIDKESASLQQLHERYQRLSEMENRSPLAQKTFEELAVQIQVAEKRLRDFESALRRIEDQEYQQAIEDLYGGTEFYNEALEREERLLRSSSSAQEHHIDVVTKSSDGVGEYVGSLETELAQLKMNDRQRAISEALLKATAAARKDDAYLTGEQVQEIIRLTEALFDEQEAIDKAESATKNLEKTNKTATDAMIRDWQNVRQSFSEFFADLLLQGDNAFKALLKSWERTALQMIGSSLFDMGASALGLAVPGGAGAGQSFMSGALGAAGGALAGGAGGVGMWNATTGFWQAPSMLAPSASATAGGGLMSGIGALATNPITWAVLGGLTLSNMLGKSTPSHNAGFLLENVPGAQGKGQTFGLDPFASGLTPVGFNRRTSVGDAQQIVDMFRQIDKTIVDIGRDAGKTISTNALRGYSETGMGAGVFFGSAGEAGRPGTSLDIQTRQFAAGLIESLRGQIEDSDLNAILAAGGVDQMIAKMKEVLAVTEDATDAVGDTARAQADAAKEAADQYRSLADGLADHISELRREQERMIDEQIRLTRDYWDEQRRQAEELHNRQYSLFSSLQSFTRSLQLGELSGLSPRDQLAAAKSTFDSLASTALNSSLGMDQRLTAAEGLQQAAEDYLREYRATNASAGYGGVFQDVMQTLEAAKFLGTNKPFDGSPIENAMLSELQKLNEQVGTLPPGIASELAPVITGFIFQAKAGGASDQVIANTIRSQGADATAAANSSSLFPDYVTNNATSDEIIRAYVKAQKDQYGISRTSLMNIRNKAVQYGIGSNYIGSLFGADPGETQQLLMQYGVPSFDQGTNFVPNDMVANIHQGERIVPAADNRQIMADNARMSELLSDVVVQLAEVKRAVLHVGGRAEQQRERQISAAEANNGAEIVGPAGIKRAT